MNATRFNTIAILLAAGVVLLASLIFANACGELVAEIKASRASAESRADAATEEVRRLHAYLRQLARFGEEKAP